VEEQQQQQQYFYCLFLVLVLDLVLVFVFGSCETCAMKSKQAKQSKAKQSKAKRSKYCRDVRTADKPASQPASRTHRSLAVVYLDKFALLSFCHFCFRFAILA
jgi:methyltransferase-like protein